MQKLTFFSAATGSRVDRKAGVLRGVSVITEGEAKGHGMIVDSTTIAQVKACAETYTDGLRVKMDHYTGIDAMVGVLRDFVIDGIQLRADLHLIKSHEDFEKLLEMAETMPGSFGLSISFSGESSHIPVSGVEGMLIEAARCMEIYSCDIVDQPAANPTGLFHAMSDTATTPEEETATEIELQVDGPAGTQNDPEGGKEIKGPDGSQNDPEGGVQEIPASELPIEIVEEIAAAVGVEPSEIETVGIEEAGQDLPEEELSSKLSEVVHSFESQKSEILSLRSELESTRNNLSALKAEVAKRDLRIADLEHTKRIALQAVGLLPSDVEIEVEAQAAPFNPVEAYAAAVEAGDKKLAAELFKTHKAAIFAARRN